MPQQKSGWLSDGRWQGIAGLLAGATLVWSIFTWVIPNPSAPSGQPPAKIVSTSQRTAVPSPVSSTITTPVPSPTSSPIAKAVAAPTETPSPPLQSVVAPTETSCPTAAANTTNVDAIVTEKGCPLRSYPVSWVFGFVNGKGIGMTSSSFMSYGSGQSLGYISQLGIAPTAPYSGVPQNAWLYQLGSGYAIVISDTAAQPTSLQLGYAVTYGGGYGMGDGAYLPKNFKLISTTPQPGGAQGYQFNLVVA